MRTSAGSLILLSAILLGIVLVGCHAQPNYAGGIGGNLRAVGRDKDGMLVFEPAEESGGGSRDGRERSKPPVPPPDTRSESN
jgi:hypothetical protein